MYRIDYDRQMSYAWDIFLNIDNRTPKHTALYFTLLYLNANNNYSREFEVDPIILISYGFHVTKERNRILLELRSFGFIEDLVFGNHCYASFKVVLTVLHPVYPNGIPRYA